MNRKILLYFILLWMVLPTAAQSSSEVTFHTLENGMELLIWPDHDIPNVALYTFVKVGSRNEVPGITGLSHFFEHMMFNGTSSLQPGEFDRVMEAAGGSNNAYTSNDLTVYQDWFPTSALPTILDLEADRFANLAFVKEVIDSEREVVYSERRSGIDNDNVGLLFEQLFANAFIAHPYGAPVLGWPSDIEAWTEEDLRRFFELYYAPNNLTMVAVGDIEAESFIKMIDERFGRLKASDLPEDIRTEEPGQLGERRFVIDKEVVSPLLQIAYRSPPAADPGSPALDLLLDILTDGQSSRLYRQMVEEQQVVVGINAYRHEGFDPSITVFYMTLPEGGRTEDAEALLYKELARIARDGVSASELQKVKNSVEASYWSMMSTINGKADALGTYHVFFGDYKKMFDVPQQYAEVTPEQIKEVAAQIFDPARRTVAILRNERIKQNTDMEKQP